MGVITDLAADVAAYFSELCGRNMPAELAEQLTRDYQQARLAALYGATIANTDLMAAIENLRGALIDRGLAGR